MSPTSFTRRGRAPAVIALALAALWAAAAAAQQTPSRTQARSGERSAAQSAAVKPSSVLPLTAAQVLTHVRRTVTWYGDLSTVEQLSLPGVDLAARRRLQQAALTAVRLAFEFGRAAEDIFRQEAQAQARKARSAQPAQGGSGQSAGAGQEAKPPLATQLERAAANLSAREAALKSQMAAIDAQLRRARGAKSRAGLEAQRSGVVAALQLVQQIESNIGQLRRFQESAIAGQGQAPKGLRAQLAELEKSVPELSTGEAPAGGGAAAPPAAARAPAATSSPKSAGVNFQPQSAGIVTLIGQWFTLHGYRVQLAGAIAQTTALEGELKDTRSKLLGTVRQLLGGGGLASITGASAEQLAAQRQTIVAAAAQLRELSSVLLPLGEQALTLSSARSTLEDWSHMLASQQAAAASYLGLRVGFLLAWVAVVLVISELWRRATFRYLQDARRRRPFLVLRRLVVGLALALVIIFSLVSQVGSVATYAGFVTAGLAVALQNVFLAIVAYFFLIGRYGVRVGDRVTISGVTGRVVDISLLRIYLMELSGPDLHSTGRMVVLSNAVLFQPTALFKQIPGAEYLWHTVTLTIVATADVEEAYRRLETAADKVYDTYRAAIERQHALAQRFIEFETAAPVPEVRVRLTDSGLECSVRYPVVPDKSARIDQQMLDALRKAVEGDERLQLVASGGMVLKSSES
ncbi:MAG TPA: mechanosensitive ion channel family protein [Steroidobacteraceae bacterium]|nr:mechanosensitive ion channel family protein [Steroidobacteraceae bacterium]